MDQVIVFGSLRQLSRYRKIFDAIDDRGLKPFPIMHSFDSSEFGTGLRPVDARPESKRDIECLVVNLMDPNIGLAVIRDSMAGKRIAGVVCAAETYVNLAVLMMSMFGLVGPGLRAGTIGRNKFLQRVACADHSPRWCLRNALSKDWDVGFPGPYVVKPLFRHSSSGVVKVDDTEGLAALMGSGTYSGIEDMLVEECVVGREFSIESLVCGGEVVSASVSETRSGELPYFVEAQHCVPAVDVAESLRGRLLATNSAVVEAVGVQDSVTHAEYRVGAGGDVYLMEIAVRLPGDAINVLYQMSCGISLEECAVMIALRERPSGIVPRRVAVQKYLSVPAGGRLAGIDVLDPAVSLIDASAGVPYPDLPPLDVDAPVRLRAVLQHRALGSELPPVRESPDRPVSLVVDGPMGSSPDALVAEAEKAVSVRTET